MNNVVAYDSEVYYAPKLKYSLSTQIAEQFCRSPLFDCYMISVATEGRAWSGHPSKFNWEALEGKILISHNKYWDQACYEELVRRGLAPRINFAGWECSANMGAFLWNRRSLADAVEHAFKVKLDKTARSEAANKHWPGDFSPDEQAKMLQYSKDDAVWTYKLWRDFSHLWPAHERQISNLTIAAGLKGVQVDVPLLNQYILAAHEMKMATEALLPWLDSAWDEDDDFNTKPTSTKCIAEQCRRIGIPAPPVASKDQDAYDEWEALYAPVHPWIQALSCWRSVNKLLKTFTTMKERLRDDGTMPFGQKYCGTHCLTGDAEVLTREGWVALQDWKGGDIAQWEPSGKIQFLPATQNCFDLEWYEELLTVDAPYFKGTFTLGHTMPYFTQVKREFRTCTANSFGELAQRCVPISGHLDEEGQIKGLQMRLLVAVQADGHWILDDGAPHLQFCLRKKRKVDRIQDLLFSLGILYRIQEFPSTPGQTRISVAARDCPMWLTPERKVFGPWLLNSTKTAREAFCEEILFWDGHRKTREYSSSILKNLEWAEIILHLSGKAFSVRKRALETPRVPHYRGIIRHTQTALPQREHLGSLSGQGRTVFCPTTKTGFWVFRQRGTVAITGNTGRVAGESKVNLFNQRKQAVLCRHDGLMETNATLVDDAHKERKKTGVWPEWVKYGIDFRNLIVARPGCRLIASDASQIEPRCAAWLAGDTAFLDLVGKGFSPYQAHAMTTMGWTGGNLKDEDDKLYALAKARLLSLGYGAGADKLIIMAKAVAGLDLTADDPEFIETPDPVTGEVKKVSGYGQNARRVVKDYRDSNPQVVATWAALENGFRRSIGGNFDLRLPSGRLLRYEAIRAETRIELDKETKKPRRRTVFTACIGGRRTITYGSKLFENAVQATAREIFMYHVLKLHEAGLRMLIGVYDEVVLEVPLDNPATASDVAAIMSETPIWISGCPLSAEGKELKCYQK